MNRVLILDGSQRSALSVARSLGKADFKVFVGGVDDASLSQRSHFVSDYLQYPDPTVDADAARHAILSYTQEADIDLLVPVSDITTSLIISSDDQDAFPVMTCPSYQRYMEASDKGRLVNLARKYGISVPESNYVDTSERVSALPKNFRFPVVLKPTLSRIPKDNGYIATEVKVAHDPEEFFNVQKDNSYFTESSWLLQSYIEGTGQGVFAMYDHGRPVAWFAHERIREKPPTGGVSVLSRSAPLSPKLKHAAKTLLDALQWHGPAMVEFRVTPDGTPYLMEINARFWGSLQLAVSAGVNFPLLAAQIAMGEHPEPVEDYKLGVYNRWLLGDLDNLYLTLKAPRRDFSLGQKLAAVGKFMIPWWPGLHYEVNQWGDMGPFWHELKHYLR